MENKEERSAREDRIWRNVAQPSQGFQAYRNPTQGLVAWSCKPSPTAATGVCVSIREKPAGPHASLVLLETGAQQCPYAFPVQYITNS